MQRSTDGWRSGWLRKWGTDYIETRTGEPMHFPCAVVEDAETGWCASIGVDTVKFGDKPITEER